MGERIAVGYAVGGGIGVGVGDGEGLGLMVCFAVGAGEDNCVKMRGFLGEVPWTEARVRVSIVSAVNRYIFRPKRAFFIFAKRLGINHTLYHHTRHE